MSRLTAFLGTLAVLFLGAASRADDLEVIRNRDKILLEKLQASVRAALADSQKLERTDPEGARGVLQDAITQVRNSTAGADETRADLVQRLQTRMREVNRAADFKRIDDNRPVVDDKIRKDPIGVRPPPGTSPGDLATSRIKTAQDTLAASDRLRAERALRGNDVFASLQQSASPIKGDVEFPKGWDRILERGKQKLSAKEVALLKALNSTMSVNFEREPLKNTLNYIMERSGLAIIVNEQSLKDANIEYDDPVTFKIDKITVRTILKKILRDRGLTYVIQEGTLQVVTAEKARTMMTVRTYPIGDLVMSPDVMMAQRLYGPVFAQQMRNQNAYTVINMIQNSVDPQMWNVNGGPGSITYLDATNSIVVRASAELHYMLGNGILGR